MGAATLKTASPPPRPTDAASRHPLADPPPKGEGGRRASDPRITAGIIALAAIALLIGGAFAGLLFEGAHDFSGAWAAFDPYLLRVVRFTLWQAVLSKLLSVGSALFVARALSRHPRFLGRAFILQLFAVPLALPAIVAALGILTLWPRRLFRWRVHHGRRWKLAGHLWPIRHSRRACLLQPALGDKALSRGAANDTSRPMAAGEPARHGARPAFRLIEWPTFGVRRCRASPGLSSCSASPPSPSC